MTAPRILVAEDQADIRDLIVLNLQGAGYEVQAVADGAAALESQAERASDLLVLDLMMPALDGLEVCKALRARGRATPILMLTAKATELDRVLGLELGADDYLTKPFSPRELVLRVQAVLRRSATSAVAAAVTSFGNGRLVIDEVRHEVSLEGTSVELTPTEWSLLTVLASSPGRVFSRAELINRIRGYEFDGYERTVDSHIKNLRRKVEADPHEPVVVETVLGAGYRLGLSRDRS